VGGTFDILHPGHLNFLKQANRLGTVVVGLNTDEFAARYKRPPVFNYDERKAMLEGTRFVTAVIPNEHGEDSRPTILKARARYVVHGDDWVGDSLMLQMGLTKEWLDEHGIILVYHQYHGHY
jgi:glycerol-3-phosphate cytidylyltransferase